MRNQFGLFVLTLILFGLLITTETLGQPTWAGAYPRLRQEVRSIGLVVRLDQKSTVYYVIYRSGGTFPACGTLTDSQIKNPGTAPAGFVGSGNFVFGDASYCRLPPPLCSNTDGDVSIERVVSVNFPLGGIYRVFITAESVAAPGPLTAPQCLDVTPFTAPRCLKVGSGSSIPDKFIGLTELNKCSPSSIILTVQYTGVDGNFNIGAAQAAVNFGDDGTTYTTMNLVEQPAVGLGTTELNKAFKVWKGEFNKTYDYSAGDDPALNPTGSGCTFRIDVDLIGPSGNNCSGLGFATDQNSSHTVWDVPNTPRGLQDVEPNGPDAADEEYEVCEQDRTAVDLYDNSIFNCTTVEEARQAASLPASPNYEARWVQWVYGVTGTDVTTGATAPDEKVTINGVDFNLADFPIYGPVEYLPSSATDPWSTAYSIQMPTTATVGQRFIVEMRSWNTCVPYDNNVLDGNGLNPLGGTFDVGPNIDTKWFSAAGVYAAAGAGTAFVDGNATPVAFTKEIVIIDTPDPPVVPSRDICNSESRTLSVTGPVGGYTYRWYSDAALTNQVTTGTSFTPGTGAGANQINPGQRKHWWVIAESGATGNCRSAATEVTLTRRTGLSQPGPTISGPTDLCPSNSYAYNLPSAPPTITISDIINGVTVGTFDLNTEYQWTVPAAIGSITAGQGTQSITINAAGAVGSGNITVVNRYVTPPATTSGNQCNSNNRSLAVNVRANPTANITPDPADVCEANTIQLNGNPATTFGTISTHTWGGATLILDASNIQQPTVQASTSAGSYNLTYFTTADFGGGVFCSSTVDNSTVNVYATPTTAMTGGDQDKCFGGAPFISDPLGGNVPIVGVGQWSQVSGPGVITFNPDNTTPNATATASAQGIYVVRWTISTGGGLCSSSEDIQLDLGAAPAVPDAGLPQDVCSASALLAGTAPTFETGTWSVTAFPVGGTVSFSDVNSPTATVSLTGGIVFGTYTLQWEFTSGTCTPESDVVNITFYEIPTATAPGDFTECISNPVVETVSLSGTFGGGASNAHWERPFGSGTFTSSGGGVGANDNTSPVDDGYIPSPADFAAGSVLLQLVTDDPVGPCSGVLDQVTVTFDRRPTNAFAGGDLATCDANVNLGATAADNGGTGTWSVGNALYYQTFAYPDGTGLSGPNPHAIAFTHPIDGWTVTAPNANTLLANDDYLRVEGNQMEAQDVNAELVWTSPSINITAIPNVTISLQMMESGAMEAADYIRAYYKINGGAEVLIGDIVDESAVDGAFFTFGVGGLSGNTLEVVVRVLNNAASEFHRFDNVFVSGSGATLPFIADVNDPASAVTGLPVGTTTFTWTVTSALGVCSSSMDQVDVTRHATPVNNNQTPALCEDAFGGGTASVSQAFLNTLNDAITGIPGSVGRTVQYFMDPARTIAFVDPSDLSNTDIVYTRVTRTDVVPGCTQDGTVTFTINSRPVTVDQTPEFCEELPVGSNTRTGIDLTTFDLAIKNGVAANSVAWFLDVGLATPVPDPTNVTANDGTTFFALITDGNGCTNDAQLEVTLNPIPGPNAILGPSNVCADPSAINLYQLTTINAGYTFTWSIPEPPFVLFGGGDPADFFALLNFPVIVSPGQDISVIETSDKGCIGEPNILNITVESSPLPITIVGPATVCENEAGVIYNVANLANTTYAWTVPTGSSIISGQGTNEITVNFGTTAGLVEVVPTTTTGCAGTPDDQPVAINPRPVLDVLTNTVCSDAIAGITLSGTIASGSVTSFNITNVSVPPGLSPASRSLINGALANEIFNDVFTNTTGGNLTVQYTVVPVSAVNCTGTASIVNLTIRPEPVLAPNLNDAICSTNEAVGITLSVATGSFPADQFEIFSVTDNGLTPVAGNPTTTGIFTASVLLDDKWENLTGVPVNVEYFVRPINSTTGCVGDPPIPVIVTVNPEPIVTPMADETICSGNAPATTLTSNIVGSTFTWTVINVTGPITGTSNGTGSNITNVLINLGGVAGSVTYEVIAASPLGCGSQPVNLLVNVNPAPTGNDINQIVCSDNPGGNTFFIDLTTLEPTINGVDPITWFEDLALTSPIATPNAYTLTSGDPVFANVDNGQCTKVATVSYTINPSPSVTTAVTSGYSGFDVSCAGASDGQITATPVNGTGPYQYSIDGGTVFFVSNIFNGLSVAGNPYVIRVRDANSCTNDSPPLNLVAPPALTATAAITSNYNGEDVSCNAAADGIITISPAGGTGAGTYSFRLLELPSNTSGDMDGSYEGLRAGTYTFVVEDGNNCQFTTSTITVTEPTPVTSTASLTDTPTCNGDSDGEITAVGGGGTLTGPSYTFTLNPPLTVNSTGVFGGLAAGNYTVTVTDDNGCSKVSSTVTVTQPSVLTAFASVTSNYNGAKISCFGANDAQVTAVPNGGNGGYAYVLDQDLANLTGNADGSYENLAPGNYSITVTDVGGCFVTSALVNVTEPAQIVASGNVTSVISCNGGNDGQITISANGGTGAYTFEQINPAGATNASGVFTGLSQATYDFEVRDLNLCADVVQVIISDPPLLTASVLVATPYNGAEISCNGAIDGVINVSASGGTGLIQYTFDQFALTNTTGQFSGVFIGVPAGVGYTFTIKDSKNCTIGTVPVDVIEPTPVSGSGLVTSNYNGEDIRCVDSTDGEITITPLGGTGAYTYKLDQVPTNTSGDGSGIYTGVGAGMYTVTIRDANSCFIVTTPVTVTPPTALTASLSVTSNFNGQQVSCNGAGDGELTVSAGGGVGGFGYVLVEIPGNVSGAATGVFTNVPAGTYTVLVTDANGCQKSTSGTVVSEPAVLVPSVSITSNYNGEDVSCNGASDGIVAVTQTGGTSTYSYTLVEIPGNTSGQSNGIFTGVPAGTYTFTITDVNSCSANTSPLTVTEPTPVTASAAVTSDYNGQDISCNGVADGIVTVISSGGTGAATYVFDPFAVSNQTGKFSGVFTSVVAGTGYTFTVTDANACPVVTAPIDVTEPAALTGAGAATSDFNGFDVSCFNLTDGQVTITPGGGTVPLTFLLLEDPGNTTGQTTGVFDGLRAGTYRVRITDVNGCLLTTAATTVTQPADLSISIEISSDYNGFDVSCFGSNDGEVSVITISGGAGGYAYELFKDGIATGNVTGQASGIFTGLVAGLYDVDVTDVNSCVKKSLPVVLVDPLPLFEGIMGFDQGICLNQDDPDSFTEIAPAFGSIGNYTYQWQESTDNVSFANVVGATSATFDPPSSLAVKTYYKRIITSGCETLESNVVSVTVNSIPTATLTPSQSPVCEGEFFILNFEFQNGTAPFFFDYDDGTNFTDDRIGAEATPVPVLNYANTTTYTLTELRDFNGCYATTLPIDVTVPVSKINPDFTITSPAAQCSGGDFTFEWNVDTDIDYTWTWADGQTDVIAANTLPVGINSITHNYVSQNTSGSTNFPVILSAINNVDGCGPKQSNQTITIYPNILINMFPDKTEVCSGEAVTVNNPTLGGSEHNWSVVRQSDAQVIETRGPFAAASNQTFIIDNNLTGAANPDLYDIIYSVNNSNCTTIDTVTVTVYREIIASFDEGTVPPFIGGNATVTYTNTSSPIDLTNFTYDWEFGTASSPAAQSGTGPFSVDYSAPGLKTVRLTSVNIVAQANGVTCSSVYEETISILMPPLVAGFDYVPDAACFPTQVTITNNTATGDSFQWQIVDQNGRVAGTSNVPLPIFDIVNPGEFTIFLTTSNSLTGQTAFADNSGTGANAMPGKNPIPVYDLPMASFQARPTTLFVPDTELVTFNFSTASAPEADSVNYWWNFGDTNDIIKQNTGDPDPTYYYPVEGNYTVTMVMREVRGDLVCTDTVTQDIIAKEGGLVKIPNAFTPDPSGPNGGSTSGTAVNDVFLPLVKGINTREEGTFLMQVFDRWGNLVFESRNNPTNGEIRGWDGYDRHGNLFPAGVYVYKLALRLVDGQQVTQVGDVTMIR